MSPDTAVAPCDRAPTVQTAVQQTTALWAATDLDGVIAAARTLLRDIAPGTRIRHGTRRVGPWPVGDDTHQFQVDLPRDGVLLVSAPKSLSPGMVQPWSTQSRRASMHSGSRPFSTSPSLDSPAPNA